MTQPVDRMVTETLRLDACAEGDDIRIPYSPHASWKSIGHVIVVKIKPLAKPGMVQIKFRSTWGSAPKVQKADLAGSIMVERRRPAVEADGPDAGESVRRTAVHEGVTYQAVDPAEDTAAAIARAVAARVGIELPESYLGSLLAGDRGTTIMVTAMMAGGLPLPR